MKCLALIIFSTCFLIWVSVCRAYEPDTHQRLSNNAAQNSVLTVILRGSSSNVLNDLGLKGYSDKTQLFPNGQAGESIDLGPAGPTFLASTPSSVQDLIASGAALEDEGYRSFCHFYDPVPGHTHALNFKLLFVNHVASHDNPDWATGSATGLCSMLGFGDEQQIYSLKNAEQYLYNALTMPGKLDRDQNFGNLFLSIGHALHLLEDMAQPQHVRNDMHCDSWKCWPVGLYHPSRYELYAYRNYSESNANYVPRFDTAAEFWSTGDGQGIAEYTNRNFFSAGTLGAINGLNLIYPLPVLDGESTEEPVSKVFQELNRPMPSSIANVCDQPNSCKMKFYSTTGYDRYSNTPVINQKASTDSIFNADLTNLGSHPLYVLNDANYQEAEKLLFPQIVGYGTGLINYFFRGRLDMRPDPNTEGGYLVINKSGYPMSNGTLTLYYDDADGNRYPVPDASWSNVSIDPAGGDDTTGYPIQFSAPTDPAPATSGEYMLVFQGKIGSEDGITGKVIKGSNQYVYLAARASSFCYGNYNCASVVESFDAAYKIHSSSIHIGTEVLQESLAVYDGVDYTIENPAWYNSNYTCNYLAMRNGAQFAASDCKGESIPAYLNTIAVNTEHVYVFANQKNNYSWGIANLYDHAGNFKSSITNLPLWYIYKASVTDSRMCLNGFSGGSSDSVSLLTDLDGNELVEFPTDPIYGAYCALTQDRMYLLNLYDGNAVLNVYDVNGSLITSLDASEPTLPKSIYLTYWDIAASDQKIYIPIIYEVMDPNRPITFIYKFIVYNRLRTRNSDGTISEKFQREPNVTLPGLQTFFGASVAVDMKDVLDSPRQ